MLEGNLIDAVSLQRPYSTYVCVGMKTIETRKSRILRTGPLLICQTLHTPGHAFDPSTDGKALCIVDVIEVRTMRPEDAKRACIRFEPNRIVFPLRMLVKIDDPFAVKGRQGRFTYQLSEELLEQVKAALAIRRELQTAAG